MPCWPSALPPKSPGGALGRHRASINPYVCCENTIQCWALQTKGMLLLNRIDAYLPEYWVRPPLHPTHKIFCNRGIVWMLQTSSKSGFPTFPFLERMAMAVPFMKHNPAYPARAVMAVAQRCAAHAGAAKWPKDPRAWHTADLGGSLHSGCGHTVGHGGMYESWIWEENLKVQLSWWWPLSSLCTTRSEVFAENARHLLTKTGGLQLQPRTLSRQPSQEAPPTTPRVPTAAALRRVPTPQCGCHRYWPSIQVNCMWDSWCAEKKKWTTRGFINSEHPHQATNEGAGGCAKCRSCNKLSLSGLQSAS